jgi:hypothetical protein
LAAVQNYGRALYYVPKPLRTPELCWEAVRQNSWALKDVPEPLRTPELCLEAVRQTGWALQRVPHALRTPEMCLEAVRWTCSALQYVPEALRTPEFCVAALAQNVSIITNLSNEELSTPEVSRWAEKNWGFVAQVLGSFKACDIAQIILEAREARGAAAEQAPAERMRG